MSREKGIPNRYHPPEFKLELVKAVLSGKSPCVVGETHNVNPGIVRKWGSLYIKGGKHALAKMKSAKTQ